MATNINDVTALAQPESPSLGLAYSGSGFMKLSAEPCQLAQAWPGLALAQAPLPQLLYYKCILFIIIEKEIIIQ